MSGVARWLLSSWVARQLRGKKTYIFAGSLALLAFDHFAGTGYAKDLVESGDLTNGQALVSGLLGLALTALKAGSSRQDKEVRDMLKGVTDLLEKAKSAVPALLACALLIGCQTEGGFMLGSGALGAQHDASAAVDSGTKAAFGVTVVGQEVGVAGELNPLKASGGGGVSWDLGYCAFLKAVGHPAPASVCPAD